MFELLSGAVHLCQYLDRPQGYAAGVSGSLPITQVDGCPECVQSVCVALLDLSKCILQFHSSIADQLFEILPIMFHLLFQPFFMEGALKAQDEHVKL